MKTALNSLDDIPHERAQRELRAFYSNVLGILGVLSSVRTLPSLSIPTTPQVCEISSKPHHAYLDDGNTPTDGTEYSLNLTCGLLQGPPPSPRDLYLGLLTHAGLHFHAEIAVRNSDGKTWLPHCSAHVVKYREEKPRTSRFLFSNGAFTVEPTRAEWVQVVRDLQDAVRDAEILKDLERVLK